jgi:hypothetical protein
MDKLDLYYKLLQVDISNISNSAILNGRKNIYNAIIKMPFINKEIQINKPTDKK